MPSGSAGGGLRTKPPETRPVLMFHEGLYTYFIAALGTTLSFARNSFSWPDEAEFLFEQRDCETLHRQIGESSTCTTARWPSTGGRAVASCSEPQDLRNERRKIAHADTAKWLAIPAGIALCSRPAGGYYLFVRHRRWTTGPRPRFIFDPGTLHQHTRWFAVLRTCCSGDR